MSSGASSGCANRGRERFREEHGVSPATAGRVQRAERDAGARRGQRREGTTRRLDTGMSGARRRSRDDADVARGTAPGDGAPGSRVP